MVGTYINTTTRPSMSFEFLNHIPFTACKRLLYCFPYVHEFKPVGMVPIKEDEYVYLLSIAYCLLTSEVNTMSVLSSKAFSFSACVTFPMASSMAVIIPEANVKTDHNTKFTCVNSASKVYR